MATGGRGARSTQPAKTVRQVVLPTGPEDDDDDVYDMDAVRAEAREQPFKTRRNGAVFCFPRATALPLDLAAIVDSGVADAIKDLLAELLGPDEWARFLGDTKLEIGEIEGFVARWLKHSGVKPGE
jgi:hypothetical protein